jgi:putative hydrolase of the HAD superfamily
VLVRARASGSRGSELQMCLSRYGLKETLLPSLLDVFRNHEPDLLLPMASRAVLESLAGEWRLAVLTNGWPAIQARKVGALGLERLVDVVVYACDVGNGRGKPAPEPFLETAARLGVAPAEAVVVGDDARCDIQGASAVGMKTIHLLAAGDERGPQPPCRSDATVWSLFEVPAIANGLMTGWSTHAA